MKLNLKGKNVLITGSTSGIGLQIARSFYKEESNIILNGRNNLKLENAINSMPGSCGFLADVTIPEEAKSLVNFVKTNLKSLDILICNVGSGKSIAPLDETYEEWQKSFAVNFWSVTNVIQYSIDLLTTNKGNIVCISSICGNETITGAPITYSCAKAALNHYVKTISKPLATKGIRINAVSPGNIIFPGSSWEKKKNNDELTVESYLNENVPLKRFGTPEEISSMVCFLSSKNAAFTTGSVFTIDGGQTKS